MREIIFRGKQVYGGKWIYGSYINPNMIISRHRDEFEINQPICVVAETIGQYTELKDRNGTKIFEGDILVDKGDKVASAVEFRNGMFCLVDYEIIGALGGFDECDCQPMDNYYIDEMKIIGNIHDNPELLKGDKQ